VEARGRNLNSHAERRSVLATELRRMVKALGYSWAGLSAAFRTQASFRADVVACAIALPIAIWLGRTWLERGVLISALVLILFAEIVNSAVESVVDRIGLEYHELSKRAKDLGSAAVLLSLINWLVIWGAVAIDRFELF
jgi:diacylglycerol kinase (ATP)